ncbi:MAG: Glutamine amidotransferase, class I [uncultured Phycisphaerae bacterium]|uniref:Glutamine amidotransferase, class I n=1 Tax=uncultured Phycisphaerae bacterium TaxID=904963 RepID=A0A6J4NNE5_9BACT|nr:MAG: Glutamine amidotransferase, class I [uncultured Phycisphaerae bacterium]
MSKAVILQHVAHEGPGRIIPLFRDFGIPTEVRRLDRGDEVPSDLDEVRVLIVLGGPMAVADAGSDDYPFLAPELGLLQRMVKADRPVLGICLGAQMLAFAAGARVYPNVTPGPKPEDPGTPAPEIGWGPVQFPFPGGTEPIVTGMIDGAPMFHWHFDTFDLPKLPAPPNPPQNVPAPPSGNSLLSSTRLCKNQAFRFRTKLFGFQYHIELDRPGIDALVAGNKAQLAQVLGPDAERTIRQDTERHYARYARLGDRILGNFVQFLKVY